jgi:hypothetical protein
MRIRTRPQIPPRPQHISHNSSACDSARMTLSEKVANVDFGSLEGVLESEGVDDEDCVVVVESSHCCYVEELFVGYCFGVCVSCRRG